MHNMYIHHISEVGQSSRGAHSMCFEDIVPKPTRSQGHLTKESFDDLLIGRMGPCHELVPDSQVLSTKSTPSPIQAEQWDDFLDENLKADIYTHLSADGIPGILLKKKDESLHLVQDYRKLNVMTVKTPTLCPWSQTSSTVCQSQGEIFHQAGCLMGYHNVRIQEGDEWKAAFQRTMAWLNL